jgi:2-polyprenyl-3-methyl-5-hydroxy-6-metoxy-1,4-benzoquinol methylase
MGDKPSYYDAEEYWKERGKEYKKCFKAMSKEQKQIYRTQEGAIRDFLENGHGLGVKEDIRTIIEVGCGFGRITKILRRVFPEARIMVIDVSEDQIKEAKKLELKNTEFFTMSLFEIMETSHCDMVFACEVLMHITPDRIDEALQILRRTANKHFIHVDWYEPGGPIEIGGYCFQHDYGKCKEVEDIGNKQAIFHEVKG